MPGLFLTGGAYRNSHSYQDAVNHVKIPGYTVYDLGARYVERILGKETTFRLNIANVTDKKYWATSYALGEPRSIGFSVTTKF
jgi:iron complex outermembrane receptor protein